MRAIILVIKWFYGSGIIDRRLCNKAFRSILGNIAYFLVVAYPPNECMQIYVYECKHSMHIFATFAWL